VSTDQRSTESRYDSLVGVFLARPEVHQEGRGFGSSALKVQGRIFAILSSRSEFVLKMPRQRVAELIASGDGLPFDAGKGRPMKEWVVIAPTSPLDWTSLAEEALAFVRADKGSGN
jgi:hypothetical protein